MDFPLSELRPFSTILCAVFVRVRYIVVKLPRISLGSTPTAAAAVDCNIVYSRADRTHTTGKDIITLPTRSSLYVFHPHADVRSSLARSKWRTLFVVYRRFRTAALRMSHHAHISLLSTFLRPQKLHGRHPRSTEPYSAVRSVHCKLYLARARHAVVHIIICPGKNIERTGSFLCL